MNADPTDARATVVLLHGSGFSGAMWRSLADRLGDRYNIVAPDLCGYGTAGGWCGRGPFRLVHEAVGVLAELGPLAAPVHLVGHSYGGAVALHLARKRPGMVRGLVLIEPVALNVLRAGDETDLAALGQIREVAAELGRALTAGDYEGGCARFVDYWSGGGTWMAMPPARRDALIPRLGKVVIDFHAIFSEEGGLDELRYVPAGTLLLQGAMSPLPVRRISRLLAGALPEAELHIVPGAGHLLPMTHADEVNRLICDHLQHVQLKETSHEDHETRNSLAGADLGRLRDAAGLAAG